MSRRGESLWNEWTGEGIELASPLSILFYTIDHVDVEHEVVRRALASVLQREGLVDSLGQAFAILQDSRVTQGYSGEVTGEFDPSVCDIHGMTYYGDVVMSPRPTTWVEVAPNV